MENMTKEQFENMKYKYIVDYDWCYLKDSGSITLEARSYNQAKQIAENKVKEMKEKFGDGKAYVNVKLGQMVRQEEKEVNND